jgi:hypothetical protein
MRRPFNSRQINHHHCFHPPYVVTCDRLRKGEGQREKEREKEGRRRKGGDR